MRRLLNTLALTVMVLLIGAGAAEAAVSDAPAKTGWVNGDVYDVLAVGNTVYVAGAFTSATDSTGTVTRNNVAAFSATTGQLLAWNPNVNGAVNALAKLPTGPIALGGDFTTVGGATHKELAEVDWSSGAPLSTFTGSANNKVRALAVGTNGWLYVGGTFTTINSKARTGLAAFNGNTLTTWAPKAMNGSVLTLRSGNGWVFAGGKFTSINGAAGTGYLDALTESAGSVVSTWNPPTGIPVHDVAITSTAVYAAADGTGGHLFSYKLTTGGLQWTVYTDGGVQAVAVIGSDVYFGGHFDYVTINGTLTKRRKLGLASTSGVVQSWAPQANSIHGVYALDNNSSSLFAGGNFTTFTNGAISQPHYAQFN